LGGSLGGGSFVVNVAINRNRILADENVQKLRDQRSNCYSQNRCHEIKHFWNVNDCSAALGSCWVHFSSKKAQWPWIWETVDVETNQYERVLRKNLTLDTTPILTMILIRN